jgi:hypothetical protein
MLVCSCTAGQRTCILRVGVHDTRPMPLARMSAVAGGVGGQPLPLQVGHMFFPSHNRRSISVVVRLAKDPLSQPPTPGSYLEG